MELIGNVKCYDWGKLGSQSLVAQLAKANSKKFELKDDCPYAELWIGDHVNGPARSPYGAGETLNQMLGGKPLPFLLKVLSIRKALSVQVHPDKVEAEKLHAEFPDIYKDPNHKPELAIALTDFQALCGFRPPQEIADLLNASDELQALLGQEIVQKFAAGEETAVKAAYERLMHSDQAAVERCIESIAQRTATVDGRSELQDLFLRLHADFGADVGVLSIYFLNYLRLKPGQSIYLAANVPHAYLDGDCVECMACSDNVVRAGLTPKFKDVDTLLRLVSYRCSPAESMLFEPRLLQPAEQPYTRTFLPPVEDFAVTEIRLPADVRDYTLTAAPKGALLLVVSGEGGLWKGDICCKLRVGSIHYLTSNVTLELTLDPTGEPFLAFQATRNDFVETAAEELSRIKLA